MAKIRATRYGNDSIQKQMDAAKQMIRDSIKEDVIALALNIHGRLVDNPQRGGTPVDTGWASANWWLSTGTPATDNTGKYDSSAVTARSAHNGTTDIFAWTPNKGPIYITNNVAYITRLNNGYSKQAPAGYVDNAVQIELTRFTHSTNYRGIE